MWIFNKNRFSSKYAIVALLLISTVLLLYIHLSEYPTQNHEHLPQPRVIQSHGQLHQGEEEEHKLEFRVVHLDLKGAPPLISYYEELFPYLKQQGANGILIEYEDMFPFKGPMLEFVPAYNAYTQTDVDEILKLAKQNELEVIPLIQTFGHLEFFLKLKRNIDMREVPAHPGSICPSYNKTLEVLYEMIDQVIKAHPGLKYLHIGCDEVYELGECSRCLESMKQHKWNKRQLFFNHVITLLKYIRSKYPMVMPLMWDDMFRPFTLEELRSSGIDQWVEPVVWNYHPNILMHIGVDTWLTYAQTFKNIWIASAFKGATGPDQLLTNSTYHLENHISWMAIVEQFKHQLNFRGIMITGWQRYDHFAVLCELLPIGMPSLVINLYYVQNYKKMHPTDLAAKAIELLQCDITFPPRGNTSCAFPGSRILGIAQRLYLLWNDLENAQRGINKPGVRGWVSDYNIRHNFSSPLQVEYATTDIDRFKMELVLLKNEFRRAAADIYDHNTIDEWIESNILPYEKKLNDVWVAREQLLSMRDWPHRPLSVLPAQH